MPFGGELLLYGQFAAASPVAYYQVLAGQWVGNPARGGTKPALGSGAPVGDPLDRVVYIYNLDGTFNSSATVRMGPFSQGGLVNLYATPAARQTGPTPPTLSPFPTIPPGGSVFWDHQGLMLRTTDSSNLIGSLPIGAVDLSIAGYDAGLSLVLFPGDPAPDDPLTLMIDNTGGTSMTAQINGIAAFKSDGTPATLTSGGLCPAYDLGPGGYVQISVTMTDSNGHLFAYQMNAHYGSSLGGVISPPGTRGYNTNPLGVPDYVHKSWVGGTEIITYYPPADCCYEFLLQYGKRVTNGDSFPSIGDGPFQTMTLKVSS
jgi:hypothetical protein